MTNTIYIHQPEKAVSFTRLPNFLFEAPTFTPLSNEAKVLYTFILRRTDLSRKNGWADEYGRIYLYYPINEVVELLHCGRQKAVNTLRVPYSWKVWSITGINGICIMAVLIHSWLWPYRINNWTSKCPKVNKMRTNRWLFSLACMLSVFVCGNAQKTPSPFQRGDRVVFLGNSITEGGHYHSYIWLYYMTHFPNLPLRMYNGGIGGDCVSYRGSYKVKA